MSFPAQTGTALTTGSSRPFALILMVLGGITGVCPAQESIDFNRDIKPILSDKCFHCHGPDARNQKSDFRLDTRSKALADLGGYVGITPGKLEESELHHRIHSPDEEDLMPPPNSNRSLTPRQKRLLDTWIREGAPYDEHWSFKALPPVVAVPQAGQGWARHEIDRFIAARLSRSKLSPAPEASPERWLRRVTLDLTGLPPTIAELDAFLRDPSEAEREKVVDRLFRSPAFAERMTADWLDVARYSDTYGYQVDRDRFVWPWRDWVIRAFTQNLTYDQFLTWQLAGDLLPDATRDQILATAFNRLHPQKVEGGSVPEEFRVEYVSDRTHTFGTAFLGLTLECSRCHDHKYDPISMRDYYSLSAFFSNIDESGLYSFFTPSIPTPTLSLPEEAQESALLEALDGVHAAESKLKQIQQSAQPAFDSWFPQKGEVTHPAPLEHVTFEESPAGRNQSVPGKVGQAVRLTGDDGVSLKTGNFSREQPFSIAFWINTPDSPQRAVVFRRSRAWTDAASRGYELLLEDGKLSAALVHYWPGNAIRIRSLEPLPINSWHHVTLTYDGSSRAAGLKLFLDGKPVPTEVIRDGLTREITGGGKGSENLVIGERFRDRGFKGGLVDEFQVYDRELSPPELATLGGFSRSFEREEWLHWFLAHQHQPWKDARSELQAAHAALHKIQNSIREIMVMRELPTPRPTYLLERGLYSDRGDEVHPDTPAALPAFLDEAPRNRLGLAAWLTTSDHPLTARVAVNRYWQLIFGTGLVRTSEDFGSQGSPPSHPALLDWLARDFVDHGWDIRHLLRSLVLSATYRQESRSTPESQSVDPENYLLSHAPRFTLPAEMVRDQALAVSGLLVPTVGGPPVKPYDLELAFKPSKPDAGAGLYRRSLYTYWKQTAPAPLLMTLDASKRDICRVRRERTSSPLQGLVLLNAPQFLEAARVTATDLLIRHGEPTSDALIREAFRRTTSRFPSPRELAILQKLVREQAAIFAQDPSQAEAYLKTGHQKLPADLSLESLATTTVLVSTLFNFDECYTKR